MITEVHQQERFYRLSTGRAAHYENLKPHVQTPGDWCVPQNMEGLEYLLVEPACEVNEKGTRLNNDGNKDVSMDDNEKKDADSNTGSFAEEDWKNPEQNEVPKWTDPEVNEGNRIDPEHVMLALTRLRDFMIEIGILEVSMPVYDTNKGKLNPGELYTNLHVVFAETEITVHLHKKYYLSIACALGGHGDPELG